MRLVAGIDGGQTATVAIVADDSGRILGRGAAGPSDHVGQEPDSRRFAEAIETSLAAALLEAGCNTDTEIAALVGGISGFEGEIRGTPPQIRADCVRFVHDAPIAHAGAFCLEPGIVIIAGTGSVAHGIDANGNALTIGGWGYLFGDEGSAFDIARRALSLAMHAEDEGLLNAIGQSAVHHFKMRSLRELVRGFATGAIGRPAIAGFAPEVLSLAFDLHPDAQDVVDNAERALMGLAWTCAMRLGLDREPVAIALAGGLFEHEGFRAETTAAIENALPLAKVVTPRFDPAVGALLMAYRDAGLHVPSAFAAAEA